MPKSILLVDDEKDIVTFVKDFFMDEGYAVDIAFCGEEAATRIEKQKPLLAIVDMKMPGIDGPALLKIINEKCPDTKVIILTGYGQQYKDKVKDLRYEGFMTKPFSAMQLVGAAKDILEGKAVAEKVDPSFLNDPHIMPKAKLLFIEPNELAAGGKKVYFLDKEKCGGEYQVDILIETDKIETKLKEYKPDIVLGAVSVLGTEGDLRSKIMKSKFKPKDIIAFGHSTEKEQDGTFVEGQFDPLTAIFVKGMMDKLGKIVRETAINNTLYVKSEEPVKVPGLELKEDSAIKEPKKEITLDNLEEFVKETIAKHIKITKDDIKDKTHLIKDLNMNTLQSIQIGLDLEEALDLDIPDEVGESLYTCKQIVDYLRGVLLERKEKGGNE